MRMIVMIRMGIIRKRMRGTRGEEKEKRVIETYIEYNTMVIVVLIWREWATRRGRESKSVLYRIIRIGVGVIVIKGERRKYERKGRITIIVRIPVRAGIC